MKIGGFQPFTLTDYPGEVAAVVFTQGCNLRCPFCHNKGLLEAGSGTDEEFKCILDFLRERKGILTGVVVTGGEPTIQKDLGKFLLSIKRLDYKVKLDTNGSMPEVLRGLLGAGIPDYVAMDVKAPWTKYNLATGRDWGVEAFQESVDLIATSGIRHHFRTTLVPGLIEGDDIEVIRKALPRGSRHVVQPYWDPKV
ncbi:MAG: anaerobic ribonucleoside-triphosphate reductase activating protein [Deltaproteobacteria bacterium]